MSKVNKHPPDHPGMSYYGFAAGAASYGVYVAANAARTYGLPIEVALRYLRRYTREGYVV